MLYTLGPSFTSTCKPLVAACRYLAGTLEGGGFGARLPSAEMGGGRGRPADVDAGGAYRNGLLQLVRPRLVQGGAGAQFFTEELHLAAGHRRPLVGDLA